MDTIKKQELPVSLEVKKFGHRIKNSIRQRQELPEILTAVVREIHSFLQSDRVKIYKFFPDGSGQVIAESIKDNRLPSLLGLNFPADDIPLHARELFIKSRVRSVVNVDTQQIGQGSVSELETGDTISEDIRYRPVDPCHVEYLTAMGVQSSVVVPILHHNNLWALLVSHNSEPRSIKEHELEAMQIVVNELSMAIVRDGFIAQAREKAIREDIINRISTLLHSLPTIELQQALEETVAVFDGSGGRLYMRDNVYTYGTQPVMPETAKYLLMEQYSVWQEHYKSSEYQVWAISDLYKIPELRNLQVAFRPTSIRSILLVPLHYRQELLGYLSIFRQVKANLVIPLAKNNELWGLLCIHQCEETRSWKTSEIVFATQVGTLLSLASQNADLFAQIQAQAIDLRVLAAQKQILFETLTKLGQSVNSQHNLGNYVEGSLRLEKNGGDYYGSYHVNP
ncbi:MAG: GAF domain-containing protein [Spirirestis rafaelensis WJT71-NPBG6]|jgi:light-regulated signal transduction histidine kinase (bacteriophytochrome)|nr:GAF domain-containing protein [Spirirestis rafaelensis WJT71-NPBG6]